MCTGATRPAESPQILDVNGLSLATGEPDHQEALPFNSTPEQHPEQSAKLGKMLLRDELSQATGPPDTADSLGPDADDLSEALQGQPLILEDIGRSSKHSSSGESTDAAAAQQNQEEDAGDLYADVIHKSKEKAAANLEVKEGGEDLWPVENQTVQEDAIDTAGIDEPGRVLKISQSRCEMNAQTLLQKLRDFQKHTSLQHVVQAARHLLLTVT